jgi:hypothetical protein
MEWQYRQNGYTSYWTKGYRKTKAMLEKTYEQYRHSYKEDEE